MIKAGIPLFDAIKILRKQISSKKLIPLLDHLVTTISNGQSLADGLKPYRKSFGEFFLSIVQVGEASGTLAENLLYLAEELRKRKALHGKVRSAMIYPIILLVMTMVITSFLTFFVFPKVMPIFSSLNVELPVTTQMLISLLSFLRAYGAWVLAGFVALIIAYRLLLRVKSFKWYTDRVFLALPAVGRLSVDVNVANFTRVLGVLLKSGVKIVEAVIIASHTFDNAVYQQALVAAAEHVRKGEPLGEYLRKEKKIFPPILTAMIEVGENTGSLEENLFYISEYYVDEVDNSIKNLTSFMEPFFLLVMGIVVGFVALSIITPIYSLTQSISN